jgi:MFS family permease
MSARTLDGSATGLAKWLPMPFVALGVSMIIVDATIVNVAVPTIIRDLHVTANTAEWFNSIYSLVFAALLITLGHTADVTGRRKLFAYGVVVFVAASLVAATAPTGGVLILGRLVQGIGGAMILPTTLSTVNALYTGKDRAVAFAIWGSTIGGMAAVGPLLGGWLTTDFSWRWAFLINVPIGLVVLAGILFVVPETKDAQVRKGLDWIGNLLVIAGFATLVFGLIEGEHYGWWSQAEFLTAKWSWSTSTCSGSAALRRATWRSPQSVSVSSVCSSCSPCFSKAPLATARSTPAGSSWPWPSGPLSWAVRFPRLPSGSGLAGWLGRASSSRSPASSASARCSAPP